MTGPGGNTTFFATLLLALVLLVYPAAHAAVPTLTLVERVTLESPPLTLQKVTREELSGSWADLRLDRLPAPGSTTTLSRAYIHMKARQQDFPTPRFRGERRRTEIYRPGASVSESELRRRVKSIVRRDLAGAKEPRITVDSLPGNLTVAPGDYTLRKGSTNPYRESRFSAWRRFELVQDDRVLHEFRARVTVHQSARVPVAAVPVDRHATFTKSMIQWKKTNVAGLDHAPVRDEEAIVGLVARRSFRTGDIIFRRHLKRPVIVDRRQEVTILYKFGNIRVKTAGLAMDEGAKGDVIEVENRSSEETLNAEIVNGSTVLANYDG